MDTTTSYVEEIDILKPQQLARAIDVEVETNILEPVAHQYTSRNGGSFRRRYGPAISFPFNDWRNCYDQKNYC